MFNPRIRVADLYYTSPLAAGTTLPIASAKRIYSVIAYNSTGTVCYLQLFDTDALPSAGDKPTLPPIQVPPNTTVSFDFPGGVPFNSRGAALFSSTDVTYTAYPGGMVTTTYRTN